MRGTGTKLMTIDELGSFGFLLQQHRKARNLSQAGLARLAGVKVETVVSLESHLREPSLKTAVKLADALNVAIGRLVPPFYGKRT